MHQSKTNTFQNILKVWIFFSITMVLSLSAAPIKIMMMGDSITEGMALIPNNPDQNISTYPVNTAPGAFPILADRIAYRGKLWDLLIAGGHDIDFIGRVSTGSNYSTTFDKNHEGYAGYSTAQLLTKVSTGLLPADIVLLHIGTNNAGNPISPLVTDVSSILNKIFSVNANAKVFLAKIINEGRSGNLTWASDYNAALTTMAGTHAHNENIEMVDMFNALSYDPAGGTNDMLPFHAEDNKSDYHPTATGYVKMAQKWYEALVASEVLNAPTTVPPTISTNHLWKLESGSPFVDSIGDLDATCIVEICPTQIVGQVGQAQDFTGAKLLNATVVGYEDNESYSIEYWMKPSSTALGENQVTVRFGNHWVGIRDGKIVYHLGTYKETTDASFIQDAWTHVVVSKDASTTTQNVKIYINGTLKDTLDDEQRDNDGTSLFRIGAYNNQTNLQYSYEGALDEVALYTSVLTATEVQAHYTAQGGTENNETNDTTPPVLAEVTAVTSETNDTTPSYTFSSTEEGNITYAGGCESNTTTATAGNNTITFNTLAEGTYSGCTITVTDEANNTSDALTIATFEINTTAEVTDSIAPVLAEVTAVTAETNDTTPSYTFSSTEEGNITYAGGCESNTTTATAGNNTITFNVLAEGTYNDCTITVTDEANNTSDALTVSSFDVNTTVETADNIPPEIILTGLNPQQLILNQVYTELGATANDDVDGNITNQIVIDASAVNTSVEGSYTVSYTVSDTAGNSAEENRTVQVLIPVTEGNVTDTDGDGIPDTQDTDDDGDGTADTHDAFPLDATEQSDLDGDGIGDNADLDDDNNGIPDAQEQGWYIYTANTKTLTVLNSVIKAESLAVSPSIEGDTFTLTHLFANKEAYISVNKTAEVNTGFKTSTSKDSTLAIGTSFKAGTKSTIKKDANGDISIQTIAKFNKNATFEIGGI